jgi:hypothetical protein
MVKMTFVLDEGTASRLRRSAECLARSQSAIVRDAIRDYADRVGRLSETERLELLRTFDRVVARVPSRPVTEVEREIRAVRVARRRGGRRSAGRRR